MNYQSNNQKLKTGYEKTIEVSFILSLLTLISLFFSFQSPNYEVKPPEINSGKLIAINLPPRTEHLVKKERPQLPSEFLAADEDEILPEVEYDWDMVDMKALKIDPPAPDGDEIFEIHQVSKSPELVEKIVPVYPKLAVRAGHSGWVVLKVLIGKDGLIEKVEILKDDILLRDAAIQAAWKYKFSPARQGIRNVRVWMSVPFHFQLK